jgi:Flp pilus assembly pilin Flp
MASKPDTQPKPHENSGLIPCGEETVMDLIIKFSADEAGATAVEYALMVALIALSSSAVFRLLAPGLSCL